MVMFWCISGLFVPACFGLLFKVGLASSLDERLVALGAVILCLEQSRMAAVDLRYVTQVKAQLNDPRLDRFRWVTLSTIVIELIGFYLALHWLGWGAFIVLVSQVWFHLLANIELQPEQDPPFYVRGISQRWSVLAADVIAIGLISLWIARVAALMAALLLFTITTLYGVVKYGLPLVKLSMQPNAGDQSN